MRFEVLMTMSVMIAFFWHVAPCSLVDIGIMSVFEISILHNEELHNLHSSPDSIRVIVSRRMRWVGHVACLGEIRDHLGDLGVDWRTILNCIKRK
jgi:hypothetical protein